MTRARPPRSHEVDAARTDPRLRRAIAQRQDESAWRVRGACRQADPDLFFPAAHEPPASALEVCGGCPVQGSCLAWALDVDDCHGVWGGTTPKERRAMAVVWQGLQPRPVSEPVADLRDLLMVG